MCNLYTMTATGAEVGRLFRADPGGRGNLRAFPEIYPEREAPVVVGAEAEAGSGAGAARHIELMQWGFPPPPGVARPVTNIRNLASPFWRGWLSRPHQRCLVPVTRFCEWTATPDPATGRKRKIWFAVKDAPLFAFAGLWRPAPPVPGDDGSDTTEPLPRTAFLTCPSNEIVGAVHPKAMPVILAPEDYETWLTGDLAAASALQRPFPSELMEIVEG